MLKDARIGIANARATLYHSYYLQHNPLSTRPSQAPQLFSKTPDRASKSSKENATVVPTMCSPIGLYGPSTTFKPLSSPNPQRQRKNGNGKLAGLGGDCTTQDSCLNSRAGKQLQCGILDYMYEAVERVTVVCLIRGNAVLCCGLCMPRERWIV